MKTIEDILIEYSANIYEIDSDVVSSKHFDCNNEGRSLLGSMV